jgi:hypothetical protein
MKKEWALSTLLLITVFLPSVSWSKRLPPAPVPPVVANGVEYEAAGNGRDEYVVAKDVVSGKEIWRVRVFHKQIMPWIEADVQTVYISNLQLSDDSLLVENEASHCYRVSFANRKVRKTECAVPSKK